MSNKIISKNNSCDVPLVRLFVDQVNQNWDIQTQGRMEGISGR